jgi:hypothetical protein
MINLKIIFNAIIVMLINHQLCIQVDLKKITIIFKTILGFSNLYK